MQNEDYFDNSYVKETNQTKNEPKSSPLKDFLKGAVDHAELARYGTSKPTRTVIRAKISDD